MALRPCCYCGEHVGLFGKSCAECKKLLARVSELRGKVGFGQFLDGLAATGVAKEKILRFLDADPNGIGSVRDQVTAEMTTELMKVMGISGSQTAPEVKRIRNSVNKEPD
jgi:hypothetical protein